MERARQAARLRWRVVGHFGGVPGDTFDVPRGELPALLSARSPRVTAEVPDRLGARATRSYELSFPKLRGFTRDALVRNSPLLGELAALGAHVAPQRILPGVERLLGRGPLYQAIAQAAEQAEPPPAASVSDASDASLRQVLAALGTPQHTDPQQSAARALDAFIQASRNRTPSAPPPQRPRPVRRAHDLLAELIDKTTCDLLQHPAVARLEDGWRGLKLVADQLPQDGALRLEVSDVAPGHELDALELCLHRPPLERPDALFVVPPARDVAWLYACAELAERLQSVCVVALDAAAWGCDSLHALRRELDGDAGHALRRACSQPALRWLSGAANRVLLYSEALAGGRERLCFGSPVWAVAGLLTAAQARHGRFARLLAPALTLQAPTFWVPSKGRDAGTALPTEEFCSARAQIELGDAGIAALGSTRRGDELLLGALPTLFVDEAPQSLPAQMLVGRLVRLSQALVSRLEPDADERRVQRAFAAASDAYLAPALAEGGFTLSVSVQERRDERTLQLHARAARCDAISPFEVSFALPWPRPRSSAG